MKPTVAKVLMRALVAFGISWALCWAGSSSSWALNNNQPANPPPAVNTAATDAIPDGIMGGLPGAKYGTYNTVVQESAREFQNRQLAIENKAFGLDQLADEDFVRQSELTYDLEVQAVRLYRDIADAPESEMTDFERQSLLFNTVRAYKDVRHHSERLYENMIRYIDKALPGPNGQQIREELNESTDHESIYYPNYRSDKNLTDAEKQQEYQKKLQGYLGKGGSLSEIKVLDANLFKSFGEYTRVEYVWLESGEFRVTTGNAGHLLLAQGEPVKASGQIVFLKGKAAGSTLMIVSNASGSYKPDLLSAEQAAADLADRFKIANELVVVTKGEPMSAQEVKIYMKGNGEKPEAIDKKVAELDEYANQVLGLESEPASGAAKAPAAAAKPAAFTSAECAAAFN